MADAAIRFSNRDPSLVSRTGSHVDDLARAIRALAADPALRERMGSAARKSVIDRNWPAAFRKFWSVTDI